MREKYAFLKERKTIFFGAGEVPQIGKQYHIVLTGRIALLQ
ncbi:hypothetical protein Bsel_1143 [[Bacillus] selenitireducens MLS10]|uniref:Uncharacterized protein n=1 Tax=Bacillus selenitireducens (strain ATCC 700615 / DSM 15326 / MLS10) TaxID=439292 RepID=D6Y156_BACIE|nr:hypothetical protein Bsel_1143 [[Bacillus] selenitireducens MLS10]